MWYLIAYYPCLRTGVRQGTAFCRRPAALRADSLPLGQQVLGAGASHKAAGQGLVGARALCLLAVQLASA
eukprot:scaffold28828_cov15-Tisochrysis_lutea.AAC.1